MRYYLAIGSKWFQSTRTLTLECRGSPRLVWGEFRNGVADADSATFVVSENKEESTLYPDCVIGFEHAAYDSAKLDVAVTSEQQDGSMVQRRVGYGA